MLVKFGENDIKTVEDLAGCATDDLVGWTERKEGEDDQARRHSRRHRDVARGRRSHDHAGARRSPAGSRQADLAKPAEADAAEDQPA